MSYLEKFQKVRFAYDDLNEQFFSGSSVHFKFKIKTKFSFHAKFTNKKNIRLFYAVAPLKLTL